MMISPEGYYEEYLKGKTAEQIMTAIRGLKQEIGHLKNTMEHPEYGRKPIMHPSEDVAVVYPDVPGTGKTGSCRGWWCIQAL